MKLKDLSTKYDFKQVEEGKYQTWVEKGYFTPGDLSNKSYCIVIPPPNVTGKLHLGHVLDNTLQDIIIRRKRMQGYDTLFLPGMDHASIATQAKVEAKLRTQGISRYDLGREKFLEVAWDWKNEYASYIRKQWATLGLSLDYTRERFTLDEGLNKAVNEVFVKMYNEGLIYQGEKIINWDIQSKTAISNIEVEYKELEGAFYHMIYKFTNGPIDGVEGLIIATTRPETMFADQALMVHPEDERYQKFIGAKVTIPLTNIEIPVISDEYVEREFGTGVVKVTPAHDPNDFEVGLRHNLARPLCMNEDGTMNSLAGKYEGMDRFVCREEVCKDLKEQGYLIKIEKITHAVGHSERTGVVVEPRLSKQWFVKMDGLAKDLLEMQKTEDRINFVPARFEKIFENWLENMQDWCISRQLWWGHQIPAWYRGEEVYVGVTAPDGEGWKRDEDALDTWFSSALWPFSTLGWPEKTRDLEKFFPTDTLVTGYDIIFFWVARMAFQSKYLLKTRPFKDVLIHGIIRDELGRKVSKSLNNGVDMYDVVNKYGTDSLRYFITTTGAPGQDIRYSEEKIEAAWNFINKIWNISRFIGINLDAKGYNKEKINLDLLTSADKWILKRLNETIKQADNFFDKYDFGEASRVIYKFTWFDFASWYIEMTKVTLNSDDQSLSINTCAVLEYVLTSVLKLLHPFMPFVTEEIYQKYNDGSIVISSWPEAKEEYDFEGAEKMQVIFDVITAVRNIRAEKNVVNSKKIDLYLEVKNKEAYDFLNLNKVYLNKFTNYEKLEISLEEVNKDLSMTSVFDDVIVIVPLKALVNIEEEKKKLQANKEKLLGEIKRCENMLSNPNFISKAPEAKINAEKEKLASYKKQFEETLKLLENL